jgi:hypothetical protein
MPSCEVATGARSPAAAGGGSPAAGSGNDSTSAPGTTARSCSASSAPTDGSSSTIWTTERNRTSGPPAPARAWAIASGRPRRVHPWRSTTAARRSRSRSGATTVTAPGSAYVAILKAAAVAVPLSPRFAPRELAGIVQHCVAWALICPPISCPQVGPDQSSTPPSWCRTLPGQLRPPARPATWPRSSTPRARPRPPRGSPTPTRTSWPMTSPPSPKPSERQGGGRS